VGRRLSDADSRLVQSRDGSFASRRAIIEPDPEPVCVEPRYGRRPRKGSWPRGSRHPCPETHNPELRSFVACPQRGCGFRDLQRKRGRASRAGTLGGNRVPGQNRNGSKSYTGPCIVSDVLVRTGRVLVVGMHDVMAGHRCQVNFERQALRPGHGFRLRRFRGCTSICRKEKAIARGAFAHSLSWTIDGDERGGVLLLWLCVVAGCDDGRGWGATQPTMQVLQPCPPATGSRFVGHHVWRRPGLAWPLSPAAPPARPTCKTCEVAARGGGWHAAPNGRWTARPSQQVTATPGSQNGLQREGSRLPWHSSPWSLSMFILAPFAFLS
jgi:hypothetical protein